MENNNIRLFRLTDPSSEVKGKRDYHGIVIHHAAYTTGDNVQLAFEIDKWHIANRWDGIGYAYVVERNGTIYKTFHAVEGSEMAHTLGRSPDGKFVYNKDFLGICLSLNGDKQELTQAQLESTVNLVYQLGIVNPIAPGMLFSHAVLQGNKTCPGYYVGKDFHQFHNALIRANENK